MINLIQWYRNRSFTKEAAIGAALFLCVIIWKAATSDSSTNPNAIATLQIIVTPFVGFITLACGFTKALNKGVIGGKDE